MSATDLGITDLPMRLLLTAIVTSMVIPVVWSAYTDLSISMTRSSIETEVLDLFDDIRTVMDSGVGSSIEVELEIREWGSADIQRFTIGTGINDPIGGDSYLVRFDIGDDGSSFMSLDPPVAMISQEGIELSSGRTELRLVHEMIGVEHICTIEMV
jgi:hypothetical protein